MALNIPSDITNRLKSRKFWVLIAFGFVATVLDELGVDITEEELRNITYVVMLYLGGQSAVDSVTEYFKKE